MNSSLLRTAATLALSLLFALSAPGQTGPQVKEIAIEHVGPAAASDELIKGHIRVKVGDPYNQGAIDDDVRNLYGTGYFYEIRVAQERLEDGLKLIYQVQGKPTLTDIVFEGNDKYSRNRLSKKITSKIGEPLDEQKLFLDSRKILEFYQKAGYQKTKVDYAVNIVPKAGRGTAVFKIQESPKTYIKEVQFNGAEVFKLKKLRKTIKTRKRWFFSWLTGSGVLKDEQLEDDREKLVKFYNDEGYIDFEIKEVRIEPYSKKKITVAFDVFEGNQYRVGSIQIKGASLYSPAEIQTRMKMGEGDIFTPIGLRDDVTAIQDFYGEKGYIETTVISRKNANVETGTMDLVYEIQEGDKFFIEKITIRGNTKTKDRVIRRELAVTPGETFDMVAVKLSKMRLENMNFFEKVETTEEPTDVPNRKDLVIGIEEKSTGNLSVGAGFSSIDSLVGFVELSQGNFDLFKPPTFSGGGQKFRLRAQLGTRRQDYVLSFVEPWFFGKKLSFGVDLFHRELDFVSDIYSERRTGATLSLSKALGSDFLIGTVSYTLEEVGIIDVDRTQASPTIIAEEGIRSSSKAGLSIAYDTRNSNFLPTAGQRTELSTKYAGGILGGQTDVYGFELSSAHYFKGFAEGHVIEVVGSVGVVDSHDNSRVPLFERYFLGGANTLRGYQFRQVGPRDALNEPTGGNTFWMGSVEYSIPIISRLRLATFYDIGMVYQDAFSFSEGGNNTGFYNDNVGVGFRLNLPIGPLRLDYGIPITSDPANGGSGRFQFGAGYTRQF